MPDFGATSIKVNWASCTVTHPICNVSPLSEKRAHIDIDEAFYSNVSLLVFLLIALQTADGSAQQLHLAQLKILHHET